VFEYLSSCVSQACRVVRRSPLKAMVLKVISLCVCLLVASNSVIAQEWRMPLASDRNNFQTQLANDFAKAVKEQTQGRVSIQTYPAGVPFKGEQIFGAVRNDLVPIGARLMSALDRESLILQLDALPYLAKSYLDAFNLYKVSRGQVEKILKIKGVKLLYAVPWPAQGLYSRVKLREMNDFKGLKFRPYSRMTADFGERLGFKVQVIPRAKLPKSLKKKQVDVLFGSALTAYQYGLVRHFGYWYDIKAWQPKEMVVVNLKRWNALAQSDREAIQVIAKRIESQGWIKSKKVADQAKQSLMNSGVVVEVLPAKVQKSIESLGLSLVQEWLDKVGDPGRYLLERYIKQ